MNRQTVAIVGAGFSGVLTALHILADPEGPRVRLIERAGAFARGVAYATGNPSHILNVRVGNMSAFPADPLHFQHWLERRSEPPAPGGFVTRGCYGDYLQDLLWRCAEAPGAAGRLLLEADEVVDLHREGAGWRITLAMGRRFAADAVVLALGVMPPPPPPGAASGLEDCPRYIADPWATGENLPPGDGPVLLLGSGLTMVDVALGLEDQARPLIAMSRRGLLPMSHAEGDLPPLFGRYGGSPAEILRQAQAARAGGDWRPVIDGLRPHVSTIWRQWTIAERRRFLRHLRPWWEVGRHRMAPTVAARIARMRTEGRLTLRAGRIVSVAPGQDCVRIAWRPRGQEAILTQDVEALVNCTGPAADVAGSRSPLIRSLLSQGVVRPDPNHVGLDVGAEGRVVDFTGQPLARLRVVGALSRAARWEITSVPDIRVQAAATAFSLIAALRDPGPQPAAPEDPFAPPTESASVH